MSKRAHRATQGGFTIIELMIAVVIVSVLMTVAMPTYRESVRRGHRANAQAFMMDVSQKEQQYLYDTRSFTTSLGDLNLSVPGDVAKQYAITIAVTAGPPPGYTITAQPKATGLMEGEPAMTLNNLGVKTPAEKWK